MKTYKTNEIISLLLDKSKKNGATDTEVIISKSYGKSLEVRNNVKEKIEEFDTFNIGIRVFKGKKFSILSTNKIDEKSLIKLADKATEIAEVSPEDNFSGIATKNDMDQNPINKKVKILSNDGFEPSINQLETRANEIENHALNFSNKLVSDGVQVAWTKSETYYSNSNNFHDKHLKSNNLNSLTLIASKSDKMVRDYDYSSKVFYNDIEDPKLIARRVAKKVLDKIGSTKAPTGKFPVIFEPRVAKSILSHIISGINGTSIINGTSFLKGKLNEHIFNKQINVIDDPHLSKGLGSKLFDAEGLGTKKMELVSNGILKNYLLNLSSARQLGLNTNCNAIRSLTSPPSIGVSNAMIMPGNIDEKDMIKNISNGFYITELLGSSVSLITGDYSRGASGFWIKNGKLSNPISEATIAGNLKEMFLQMVPANNLDLNSTISAPSILINEMTIAGGSNT